MGTSVRKLYDAELMQLDTMLARMGHAAGGAIESAMTALRTGDVELARSVIARDSEIDSAEHEIEHRCLTLFLRQQRLCTHHGGNHAQEFAPQHALSAIRSDRNHEQFHEQFLLFII